ncbi:alcohol dehydrogenase catalytic domain-containing protein [Baaleninema sp.]|uniref:alcohol dehydrogenase catalytic domain-containing protein n=1 Tax=Baaleninema sp. TaxID=3101197 RepID=UPI003CFCF24A
MKAQVFRGVDRLCYEDLPQPTIATDEVLLKVEVVGVSPRDLQALKSPDTEAPCVLGSEIAGTIAAVGESVSQWWVGQRVATVSRVPCMRCRECLRDRFSLCSFYQNITTTAGLSDSGGGFAEYVKVPAHLVHHGGLVALPGHITLDRAALLQPLNLCLAAIDRLRFQPGQQVWILGAGSIGSILVLLLKQFGMRPLVSDPNPDRLDAALDLGAEAVFAGSSDDLHTKICAFTDGEGVEAAILTEPSHISFLNALDGLRPGGKLVCLTDYADRGAMFFDPMSVMRRQIDLLGCAGMSFRLQPMAIDLLFDHRLPLESVVSDRLLLSDLPEVVERGTAEKTATRKILVYPH